MNNDNKKSISETVPEVIPEKDAAQSIEHFSVACRKICQAFQKGRMTHDELQRRLSDEIHEGFFVFLQRHEVYPHITAENWPDFMNDYHLWSEDKLPTTQNPIPWFRHYRDGSDVSAQDKNVFLNLMHAFCISPKYYQPLAEGYAEPDLWPGHFPDEYVIGLGNIWEDDGGLLSKDFQLGDAIILTDHYGLKSEIKVTKRVPDEDVYKQGNYVGFGYIEGYTSKDKSREIHIFIDKERIHALSIFTDFGEELEVFHYPLWDEWNKLREEHDKSFLATVEKIEEKYSNIDFSQSSSI